MAGRGGHHREVIDHVEGLVLPVVGPPLNSQRAVLAVARRGDPNSGSAHFAGLERVLLGDHPEEAALQVAERIRPDPLGRRDLGLDQPGEIVAKGAGPRELDVAVAVHLSAASDDLALGVVDALGDGHKAAPVLEEHLLHAVAELLTVKDALGEVDQVGPVPVVAAREPARSGQPASVAPHVDVDLDATEAPVVLVISHESLGNEARRRCKARGVVAAGEVVVNRLRHVEETNLVADLEGSLVEQVGRLR